MSKDDLVYDNNYDDDDEAEYYSQLSWYQYRDMEENGSKEDLMESQTEVNNDYY